MTSRVSQKHPDLSVEIAGIHLKGPLIAASGTFGYGTEYLELADYEAIGAIAVKGQDLHLTGGGWAAGCLTERAVDHRPVLPVPGAQCHRMMTTGFNITAALGFT